MKMFTSLQRHYRGFIFQRDFESREEFNEEMKADAKGNQEICWAYLFNNGGDKVAKYKRGYTMAKQTGALE